MLQSVCDECGAPSTIAVWGLTGRVLIDGKDNNLQGCDLCDEHRPRPGMRQPHNCQRVRFYWPGMPEWNAEPV
jgi:hypothetical protein